VNLTAPHPVTNAEFTDTLGRRAAPPHVRCRCRRSDPSCCSAGSWSSTLLFSGQRVLPTVLNSDEAFTFRHPELSTALHALLGK
jgi:uncharacterized protein